MTKLEMAVAEAGVRRDRLCERMRGARLDAVAIVSPELIYYLCGAEPHPGQASTLLIRNDRALLVWPTEAPGRLAAGIETLIYDPHAAARSDHDSFAVQAGRAAASLKLTGCRVGLDGGTRPLWLECEPVDATELFTDLTRRKSPAETAAIEANLRLNDLAFAAVAEKLAPGRSDLEILDWCASALVRGAGGPVAYEGNIGLGSNGDYYDAQARGVVAPEGASLFVDLYCRIGHYVGDSTRTFSAGSAPSWLRDAHGRLERTLEVVERHIRPGMLAGDLDRRCREELDAGKAGGVFPHHTGHGVGLRAHERPYLVPGSEDELRPGDVVAVEPGIYFAGRGGARLEEVYFVTDDGAQPLTGFPRGLTECHGVTHEESR
jgi:Xaa-Pro aminopeptidase